VWDGHRLFNQPADKFLELQHYFQLNLDETCIMGSFGSQKIVGSAEVKKHERTIDDNREAITIVYTLVLREDIQGLGFFL
jgi:hypothetical protein